MADETQSNNQQTPPVQPPAQASEPNNQQQTDQSQIDNLSFDDWFKAQPDAVKDKVDGHIAGLKSSLESEQSASRNLQRQLKELSKQASAGSEIKSQLDEMVNKLAQADGQRQFYEDAHNAGVKNLRLAWLAATDGDMLDKRNGRADFEKLKQANPELFHSKTPAPSANAGSGVGQSTTRQPSMNDFIRQSARRG